MSDYYTIQDFEKANYAIAVNPGDADAIRNPSEKIWRLSNGLVKLSDAEIQRRGKWVPVAVQENPRPLIPDAITDEMIERAREVLAREEWVQSFDPETADTLDREDHADATRVIIAALTAALTEPPARPEGARELETVIGLNAGKWTNGAEDVRALADLLASNGVRATGGE